MIKYLWDILHYVIKWISIRAVRALSAWTGLSGPDLPHLGSSLTRVSYPWAEETLFSSAFCLESLPEIPYQNACFQSSRSLCSPLFMVPLDQILTCLDFFFYESTYNWIDNNSKTISLKVSALERSEWAHYSWVLKDNMDFPKNGYRRHISANVV